MSTVPPATPPTGPVNDPSWVVRALLVIERISRVVVPVLAAALAGYAAHKSTENNTQIGTVVAKQDDVVERADKVQTELSRDRATMSKDRADEAKHREAQNQATAVNLRTSWQYLKGIADDDPTPANLEAAKEARRVYDGWKKKITK